MSTDNNYMIDGYRRMKRRQYTQALELFGMYVSRNPDDAHGHYLLGMAYLFSHDYRHALNHIDRARRLSPAHLDAQTAFGFIQLKMGAPDEAITTWLAVLSIEQDHAGARTCINKTKRTADINELTRKALPYHFLQLAYPRDLWFRSLQEVFAAPVRFIKNNTIIAGGIFFIIVMIVIVVAYKPRITNPAHWMPSDTISAHHVRGELSNTQNGQIRSVDLSDIVLPDEERFVVLDQSPQLYVFSDAAIEKKFKRVKRYITEGKLNSALVEINEALHSNATEGVRRRFAALKEIIIAPPVPLVHDTLSWREIENQPVRCQDIFVSWTGRAVDVRHVKGITKFQLLIEGEGSGMEIVEVTMDGKYKLRTNAHVTVLGRFRGLTGDIHRKFMVDGYRLWY